MCGCRMWECDHFYRPYFQIETIFVACSQQDRAKCAQNLWSSQVDFYLDDTLDEMYRLNQLFDQINKEDDQGEESA